MRRSPLWFAVSSLICLGIITASTVANAGPRWVQLGQVIAGPSDGAEMGFMALSDDGRTIVVGGPYHDQARGYAAVYRLEGDEWFIMGSPLYGEDPDDLFGAAVDLNADGTVLAVGAPASYGTGNQFGFAGEVSVYEWDVGTSTWSEPQMIRMDQESSGFGDVVRLNAEGDRLLVTSPFFDDESFANRGAVYVLEDEDDDGTWSAMGTPILGDSANDLFGIVSDFSSDGQRLVAGSNQVSDASGEVRIYNWKDLEWQEEFSLTGEPGDFIGISVTIDGSGSTTAFNTRVSASEWVISIYERTGNSWSQSGLISGPTEDDLAVDAIDMSTNGDRLVSRWSGLSMESQPLIVFDRRGDSWLQIGNGLTSAGDNPSFGQYTSIAGDGTRVAGGDFGGFHGGFTRFVQVFELARARHSDPVRTVTLDPAGGTCVDGSPRTQQWTSAFRGTRFLPGPDDCARPGHVLVGWADTTSPTVIRSLPLVVDPSDGSRRFLVNQSLQLVAVWQAVPVSVQITDLLVLANFLCGPCTTAWLVYTQPPTVTGVSIVLDGSPATCARTTTVFRFSVCELVGLTPGVHNLRVTPYRSPEEGATDPITTSATFTLEG